MRWIVEMRVEVADALGEEPKEWSADDWADEIREMRGAAFVFVAIPDPDQDPS